MFVRMGKLSLSEEGEACGLDGAYDLYLFQLSGGLKEQIHKVLGKVGEIALPVPQQTQPLNNGLAPIQDRKNVDLISQLVSRRRQAHVGTEAGEGPLDAQGKDLAGGWAGKGAVRVTDSRRKHSCSREPSRLVISAKGSRAKSRILAP